jgi:hypothetical protein
LEPDALYSDRDSPKMLKERRKGIRAAYLVIVVFSILLLIAFLDYYVTFGMPHSIEDQIVMLILWSPMLLVIPIIALGLRFRANQMKIGVTVTRWVLRMSTLEIRIANIIRAETVWIAAVGTYLAIDYLVERSQKRKILTLFIPEKDTHDIYVLRNTIRKLRGWPEQDETPMYTFRRWRKERDELLRKAKAGIPMASLGSSKQ